MKRGAQGFTLVELMIAVAVIGILTAVALPAYNEHVTRSRLTEAFSALAAAQPSAEQFWANGRTFEGFGVANGLPAASANFTYALTTGTASAYTIKATGTGNAAGFSYTIDQSGTRATLTVPDGWTRTATCWTDRKSGACTQ